MALTQEQVNSLRSQFDIGSGNNIKKSLPTNRISRLRQLRTASEMPQPPEPVKKKEAIWKRIAKVVAPIGETVGEAIAAPFVGKQLTKANEGLISSANDLLKRASTTDDPDKREKFLNLAKSNFEQAGVNYDDVLPSINKSKSQILGEGLVTSLSALSGGQLSGAGKLGAVGGKLAGLMQGTGKARLATGATQGGLFGLGGGLEAGKTKGELIAPVATGAAIGLAFAGLGEAARKMKGFLRRRSEIGAQRSLKIPKGEIRERIRFKQERIGREIINGKYKGSVDNVIRQAERNKDIGGKGLENALKKHSDKVISRDAIRQQIADVIDDPFNVEFKDAFEKTINRMPENMNPSQANQWKQRFAKEIFGSSKTGARKLIKTEKKLFMRDLWSTIRHSIDDVTGDGAIKSANKKWASAQNVLEFSEELKATLEAGTGGRVSLWSAVNKLLDKTIFSTRAGLASSRALDLTSKVSTGGVGKPVGAAIIRKSTD